MVVDSIPSGFPSPSTINEEQSTSERLTTVVSVVAGPASRSPLTRRVSLPMLPHPGARAAGGSAVLRPREERGKFRLTERFRPTSGVRRSAFGKAPVRPNTEHRTPDLYSRQRQQFLQGGARWNGL